MDKNMYELTGSTKTLLPEDKIKMYMYQLIKAIDHMHRKGKLASNNDNPLQISLA